MINNEYNYDDIDQSVYLIGPQRIPLSSIDL